MISQKINEVLLKRLKEVLEGRVDEKAGIIIAITKILERSEGTLKPMDPNIYYQVKFEALCYKPDMHEIVKGKVVDNTRIGSFIRFGPLEGFIHISQIMDDYVAFDEKNQVFMGKTTKKNLKIGDLVIARIISISFENGYKIGLTMRQPGLGNIVWIEKEKKKKR